MLKDIAVTGQKDTRSGFGDEIVEAGSKQMIHLERVARLSSFFRNMDWILQILWQLPKECWREKGSALAYFYLCCVLNFDTSF